MLNQRILGHKIRHRIKSKVILIAGCIMRFRGSVKVVVVVVVVPPKMLPLCWSEALRQGYTGLD